MGLPIALITGQWWLILTYYIATSACPYGDNSWLQKLFGSWKWFVYGCIFGAASLNIGNILWCGCLAMTMKYFDADQAWWEFGMGGLGTLVFVFK
jgi:hypothetical protein